MSRHPRQRALAGEAPRLPKPLLLLLTLATLLAALPLMGCNTVEGVGKDTSAAGRAVTDTARDVKQGL